MFSSSNLSYGGVDDDGEVGFVYYDITVSSNRTEETGITDPQVRFSETRAQPILADCSKYNMSIIRFTMDGAGSDLPLWIPTIMPDAQQKTLPSYTGYDANKTIYAVTLKTSAFSEVASDTVYLEWTSETFGASAGTNRDDKYYYCYSYSHFCDMMNAALLLAFNQTKSQITRGTVTTKPPILTYNGSTNLFSFYCDSNGFGSDATSANELWEIRLNANLYQLLRNFDNVYYPNRAPNTNTITVRNRLNNIFVGADGTKYYVETQDYRSTDAIWSPVSSIVFTSSLLPLVPEQLGQPIVFSNDNVSTSQTSQANFQQTITDIALPLDRSSDYKGFVQYAPNPYRMISMSPSKQEVRNIDVMLFWKSKQGRLHPMTLPNGASVSIKFMFRKKSLGI